MNKPRQTNIKASVQAISNQPRHKIDLIEDHANRTRALMLRCLILWVVFSVFIHLFVDALNNISFLGFPLGWWVSAQGSLIVFVVLCFWYSARQNHIDHDCGLAEPDQNPSKD